MCLTAQEKIRNRMKIKNKTAGHAGIACFSFALKGNRAGSPHFKIVRFKWWEHVTLYSLWSKYRTTSGSWSQSTLCRRGSQRREDSAQWKQSSHKLSSLGICWSIRYRTLYFCVILKGNKAEEASK